MSEAAVKIWPDSAFPEQIIADTTVRAGLRTVQLGEEGETWVFLGHAYRRDVLAAIETINREDKIGLGVDELPVADQLRYTYARVFTACPDHGESRDDECGYCDQFHSLEPISSWLEWSGGGTDGKANRGKPGYFPVVLWDVEG
ncbi:hypothetical protein ACIOD2_32210 [Amycolatopsis sp. NPDC088138]|uniref:hypothetical protein n=1 Tax=Amycolatopsis sp. NPDC088138 TaxID=3363938 RepID=UPI00381341E2